VTIAVAGVASAAAQIWRLTAPALDAISGVTLAGAEIGRGGEWRPAQVEHVWPRDGVLTVELPRASAALVLMTPGT
jgi:hypothetical protein